MTILGNFQACLKLVLASEGGWSDDKADPGGATMQGVTQAVYNGYRAHQGRSLRSVRLITPSEVESCFALQYWMPIQGNRLPVGVSYAVFDFAVNSGVSRAAKALQRVVGATADGHIGFVTMAAVEAMPAASVVNHLCDLRQVYLESLPTFGHFGKGWTARVASVRAKALEMILPPPSTAAQAA